MSVIAYTEDNPFRGVYRVTWANITNGDTGAPYVVREFADMSVQVEGTFGASGNLNIEGSNKVSPVWAILNDPQGNALSITSAGLKQILEKVFQIRPNDTVGDGTTALNVTLILTRT
jgi:hypothetical protein